MSDDTEGLHPRGQDSDLEADLEMESVDVSEWEKIEVVNTVREATLLAGFLRSNGIPAAIESRFFTQEPVSIGTLGKVDVFVPRERLAEAEQLLDRLEKEPFDELARESQEAEGGNGSDPP